MSRLTGLPPGLAPTAGAAAAILLRRMEDGSYLLTNDFGDSFFVSEAELRQLLEDRVPPFDRLEEELANHRLLRGKASADGLADLRRRRRSVELYGSPRLHRAATRGMSAATARAVAAFAAAVPGRRLELELDGPRPLDGWEAARTLLEEAARLAARDGRPLTAWVASDLGDLTEERLAWLRERRVSVRPRLDAPPDAAQAAWLRRLAAHERVRCELLVTRRCTSAGPRLASELGRLGARSVRLVPSFGPGAPSSEAFARFYEGFLDRCVSLGERGPREGLATELLRRLVNQDFGGFVELRSPSGAGSAELAYDRDGGVWANAAGRELGARGDRLFRLGDARSTAARAALARPVVAACARATTLERQPMCADCAYRPYCGTDPAVNYALQGTLEGRMPASPWCRAHMAVFDALFSRLRRKAARTAFERWLHDERAERDPEAAR